MNKRRISMMLIITLMILAIMACEDTISPTPGQPFGTPSPYNQEGVYAAAQATLAAGQREAMELSHQATVVSLNMDQAAKAAAQTTLEYNQRQLMDLSVRATEVSQNMARAAATQQFIAVQTQMAWNATAIAQGQAATATYSAYIQNATQTAQAQALLNIQSTQSAQAYATLTAYPLTATPWAALQADILRIRKEAERRAWWEEFVVTPLIIILLVGVILLLIVGGVMAYQRLMPALELRLRSISRQSDRSLPLADGIFVDPNQRQLSSDGTPQVEIVGPSEPSISNWITEAEQELHAD
ncbi:MAG: hypothetical protein AB1894_29620 [Chloroflexota bacterium]